MDKKNFSKYKKRTILDQCVRCGICLGNCPVYRISRLETDSPRGRLELIRSLAENKAISFYDCKASLSRCLFCLLCQRNCPAGVEYDLSFFRIMELFSRTDSDTFIDSICPRGSENLQSPSTLHIYHKEEKVKGAKKGLEEAIIFPGCFIELKEIKRIQASLKDKGIDSTMISEDICCGLPYLLKGNKKEALRCMKQNLSIFHRMKIKSLFTPCPFCLKMFKIYYPLFLNQRMGIEFKHVCDFFSFKVLKPTCKLSKKVGYHSPCLLDQKTASNHQHIIEKLAGNLFIPIPAQICCGHGIGLPYINEGLSKKICQGNLSKIIEKGVQVLITDCPSCTTKWIEGVKEKNLDLEVVPFWNLVANMTG